jgi:uncharacterized protein YidB (DUF937 family)
MPSPDTLFGSDSSGQAVPGGSVAKPLMIALLALLASRYFGGGQSQAEPSAPEMPKMPKMPTPVPGADADASPGNILDGLGGLIKQFQQKGLGDAIDSWINPGSGNKNVAAEDVSVALGGDVVNELSKRTGLSRDQVVAELARMLPNVVDKLTPNGRLPTQQELMRLMS